MARIENIDGFARIFRVIFAFCYLICLQKPVESGPVSSRLVAGGIDWLTRYGYLVNSDPRTGNLRTQQDLEKSIKMLQRYAGIPETGQLDAATIKLMGTSRCGVADFGKADNTRRRKRYTLQGTYWKKRDLTYRIKSFTPDIRDQEVQRKIFKKAFDLWSGATNLRIKEDRRAAEKDVDIHISFDTGYHKDAYPFDGQGGTLAHAFYPHNNLGLSGDAHFDDDETFTTGEIRGVNLDWVAVHEFGHSLGLEHSNVRGSIMYPWYQGYKPNIKLTDDDILGIQGIYGKPPQPTNTAVTTKPPSTKPPIPEENDVCSVPSYDTFFMAPDKKTYALRGSQFWIISSDPGAGLDSGPHKVTELWKELPNHIDAAYMKDTSRLVFFSGSKFWQYYYYSSRQQYRIEYNGYSITKYGRKSGLPAELSDMDAVFIWGRNSKTYFFKGDRYWRFYANKIDYGYPKSISAWKGLPEKIDAAMKWRNGKSYFFAGGQYYRFDDWNIQVGADYPKSIALKWMRCEKDNLEVVKPTEAEVAQNATQGCPCTCSSGSAVLPSLVTLLSLLFVFVKLNC